MVEMNLNGAIDSYAKALKARGLSLGSITGYSRVLNMLSKATQAEWPRYPELVDWVSGMENLNKTTMHHRVSAVKSFFAWAFDMEYIPANPAAKLITPKRAKGLPEILTESQVMWLLREWTPYYDKRDAFLIPRDKAIVRMYLLTGLRRAELCSLDVGDINLAAKTVSVRHGKGDKARVVPLSTSLVFALKEFVHGREPGEPLFLGKNIRGERKRLAPDAVTYIFVRKVSPAIGRKVTPHMCRHSCGTMLARRGKNIHDIKDWLGHESLDTTTLYLHTSGRDLRALADSLDDIA
jgi:integrase/recombinase XerC